MSNITSLKDAYKEGWGDGHSQGLSCGHGMAPRCRFDKELAQDFYDSYTAKASSGWISVEDRLPNDESGYKVLVYANDILGSWVQLLNHNGKYWVHNGGEDFPAIVTHWQPLPSPPEAIKESK